MCVIIMAKLAHSKIVTGLINDFPLKMKHQGSHSLSSKIFWTHLHNLFVCEQYGYIHLSKQVVFFQPKFIFF